MRARTGPVAAGLVALLVLVGGCSGGSSDSSGGASDESAAGSAGPGSAGTGVDAVPDASSPKADTGPEQSGRVVPGQRILELTASLRVRVRDVAAAGDAAERAVKARGGVLFGEQSWSDPDSADATTTTLVLKVPTVGYPALLEDLDRLGERLWQTRESTDRTSEVVDVDARLASQRESVARVRALLARATTVAEIVQVESELARRQADLEALEAQQASLRDRTSLATVTLELVGPHEAAPGDRPAGFLGGLRAGWDGMITAAAYALTWLGASIPFVAAGGLLLLAGLRLRAVRRRRVAPAPVDDAA